MLTCAGRDVLGLLPSLLPAERRDLMRDEARVPYLYRYLQSCFGDEPDSVGLVTRFVDEEAGWIRDGSIQPIGRRYVTTRRN